MCVADDAMHTTTETEGRRHYSAVLSETATAFEQRPTASINFTARSRDHER